MLWAFIVIFLGVVLGMLQLKKEEHGKTKYWIISAFIIGVGIAGVLKEAEDSKRSTRMEQALKDSREETKASEGRLQNMLRISIERIGQLQSKVENADLQKRLKEVKTQLEALRNAPKATLSFGLLKSGDEKKPIALNELPKEIEVGVENPTRLGLVFGNAGKVSAMNVYAYVGTTGGCRIVSAEDVQRMFVQRVGDAPNPTYHFDQIPLRAYHVEYVELEIANGPVEPCNVTFRYSCPNCIPKDANRPVVVRVRVPTTKER